MYFVCERAFYVFDDLHYIYSIAVMIKHLLIFLLNKKKTRLMPTTQRCAATKPGHHQSFELFISYRSCGTFMRIAFICVQWSPKINWNNLSITHTYIWSVLGN